MSWLRGRRSSDPDHRVEYDRASPDAFAGPDPPAGTDPWASSSPLYDGAHGYDGAYDGAAGYDAKGGFGYDFAQSGGAQSGGPDVAHTIPVDLERRRRRIGTVGLAAIVAATLAAFGVGAVLFSPVFGSPSNTSNAVGAPAQPPPQPAPDDAGPPTAEATPELSTEPSQSASPDVPVENAAAEDAVVALVNAERARARCGPVRHDDRLRASARAHSADMAGRRFLSERGTDGSTPARRMRAAGYDAPLAENVARGFRSARDVTRGWLRSREHRVNIVNCRAEAIGVGVAVDADGTPYWTQDFGRE